MVGGLGVLGDGDGEAGSGKFRGAKEPVAIVDGLAVGRWEAKAVKGEAPAVVGRGVLGRGVGLKA